MDNNLKAFILMTQETIIPLDFFSSLKLDCDTRFQRAFTECGYVFKVISLVGSKQSNYFQNATLCGKCTLKTHVATQLKA